MTNWSIVPATYDYAVYGVSTYYVAPVSTFSTSTPSSSTWTALAVTGTTWT